MRVKPISYKGREHIHELKADGKRVIVSLPFPILKTDPRSRDPKRNLVGWINVSSQGHSFT